MNPSTIKMTRVMCIRKHNDTMSSKQSNAGGRHKTKAEPPMQDSLQMFAFRCSDVTGCPADLTRTPSDK